jgi:hypothetical protein
MVKASEAQSRHGVTDDMASILTRTFTCPFCQQSRIGFVLEETLVGTPIGIKIAHHEMALTGLRGRAVASIECPLSGLPAHEVTK